MSGLDVIAKVADNMSLYREHRPNLETCCYLVGFNKFTGRDYPTRTAALQGMIDDILEVIDNLDNELAELEGRAPWITGDAQRDVREAIDAMRTLVSHVEAANDRTWTMARYEFRFVGNRTVEPHLFWAELEA